MEPQRTRMESGRVRPVPLSPRAAASASRDRNAVPVPRDDAQMKVTVRHFLRDTCAGATAIAAVAVTVMAVGGAALIVDHTWLVDQRDVLKSATDAAAVAATLEMNRQLDLDPGISDDDLEPRLKGVARRYVMLNFQHLPPDRLATAVRTLKVVVTPRRSQRNVDVEATADLGGTLLSRSLALLGNYKGPEDGMRTESRAENVNNPVEVVLAIDISQSMGANLKGRPSTGDSRRIEIVKRAATDLVDVLGPDGENRIAIGIVPWHTHVRLDAGTRDAWERNGWAQYPLSRHYGASYFCGGRERGCTPTEVDHDLSPSAPETWLGCLDEHRLTGLGRHASLPSSGDLSNPPGRSPFAQSFFSAAYGFAYECLAGEFPDDYANQICHDGPPDASRGQFPMPSQHGCAVNHPVALPLSSDRAEIAGAIDALEPVGARTYSALGVLWAHRLLEHSWKDVWGGDVHPVDPDADDTARKVIVLLTDGEDSHCGIGNESCADSPLGIDRSDACSLAKETGNEIFVVAAMHPRNVSGALGASLRACSSESENPDGTYAFLDNATPENLEDAFADIANQLITVWRVY